jgi:hypothetical protein
LNDEVLFLIPNPSETKLIDEVEFLDVSSRKLSLVVLPPETTFVAEKDAGVKVILGQRRFLTPYFVLLSELIHVFFPVVSWLDPQGRPKPGPKLPFRLRSIKYRHLDKWRGPKRSSWSSFHVA